MVAADVQLLRQSADATEVRISPDEAAETDCSTGATLGAGAASICGSTAARAVGEGADGSWNEIATEGTTAFTAAAALTAASEPCGTIGAEDEKLKTLAEPRERKSPALGPCTAATLRVSGLGATDGSVGMTPGLADHGPATVPRPEWVVALAFGLARCDTAVTVLPAMFWRCPA